MLSKLWLIRSLKSISPKFGTIYILGSWYGNLSLLILDKHLAFDKIINVDINKSALRKGDSMTDKISKPDRIESMCKDANKLDYQQLGKDGLVINTSCNNIPGKDWFNHIPKGTMVALQGRNLDPKAVNHYDDLNSFLDTYPCSELLHAKEIELEDPETKYSRYMLIGIK